MLSRKKRQVYWIIILAILTLFSFLETTNNILNSALKKLDTKADEHLTELSIKAATSYGIARGLNGIISVLQGTKVITISIGEVLDPINDLVEKFSTVMLISLSSLGLQLIIHKIGMALAVRWFLSFGFLFLLIKTILDWFSGDFKKTDRMSSVSTFLKKLISISELLSIIFFLAFILIRFIIPVSTFVSISTESIIMQNYNKATSSLEEIEKESKLEYNNIQNKEEKTQKEIVEEDSIQIVNNLGNEQKTNFFTSILDKLKNSGESLIHKTSKTITSGISSLNPKNEIDKLISYLSGIVSHAIDLIIIFIMQTIIIPIATLWGLKILVVSILKDLLKKKKI